MAFVQRLGKLQGPLCAEAVNTVRVTLQLGQVIKRRRPHPPLLHFELLDICSTPANSFNDRLCIFAVFRELRRGVQRLDTWSKPRSGIGLPFARRERRYYVSVVFGHEVPY